MTHPGEQFYPQGVRWDDPIARGTLPAARVYVYWVEQLEDGSSVASRITFDTLGRPEGPMPSGAFADQRRLAQELQREQSQRSSAR